MAKRAFFSFVSAAAVSVRTGMEGQVASSPTDPHPSKTPRCAGLATSLHSHQDTSLDDSGRFFMDLRPPENTPMSNKTARINRTKYPPSMRPPLWK